MPKQRITNKMLHEFAEIMDKSKYKTFKISHVRTDKGYQVRAVVTINYFGYIMVSEHVTLASAIQEASSVIRTCDVRTVIIRKLITEASAI